MREAEPKIAILSQLEQVRCDVKAESDWAVLSCAGAVQPPGFRFEREASVSRLAHGLNDFDQALASSLSSATAAA
jgi:hypothetical protein